MTPIERVRQKSKAIETLGMRGMPSEAEIKEAYKRMVMARHPDRGEGTNEELSEITAAFQFLMHEVANQPVANDSVSPVRPVRTRTPSRPMPAVKETVFDDQMIAKCEELQGWDERQCEARHVAVCMRRSGREITYIAPTALRKGLNTVALPAADLSKPDVFEPVLVTVRSTDDRSTTASLPGEMRERLFAGARSVRIEFSSN